MKKIIKYTGAIMLMFAFLISLFGCSSGKYVFDVAYAGDTVKQAGERAVEIVDNYLSFQIEKEEMMSSLSSISERLGDYSDYDRDPDRIAVDRIGDLSEFSHMYSDDEITKIRDIIAVNCGMQETGRIFDMGKTSKYNSEYAEILAGMEDDKEKVIDKYSLDTTGMSSLRSSKRDDGTVDVYATFDYSYGYSPESVSRFLAALQDEAGKGTISALASIEFYEQSVASISTTSSSYVVHWAGRKGDEGLQVFDTADELLGGLSSLEIKR